MGDRAPPEGPLEGALEAGGAPTRGLTFCNPGTIFFFVTSAW